MKQVVQTCQCIVAILGIAYGISKAALPPHNYFSGFTFVGLGLYGFWRIWHFRNDPRLYPPFTLTRLMFWVAILLAGVLLWWTVQAR